MQTSKPTAALANLKARIRDKLFSNVNTGTATNDRSNEDVDDDFINLLEYVVSMVNDSR
eukprot:CAMPEP_0194442200 /NCGR_PEP_ID=MMETSP0176-20130528/125559_1 /TAXON_ID=216777 /ORGANISM="Proboscia alata, Strain PI-D3" /LENGTH=58 /DNA_ID=CAMNT_0039268177 /DNA_START=10 /DNA_END=183 /DNA_ORIENTATION=-